MSEAPGGAGPPPCPLCGAPAAHSLPATAAAFLRARTGVAEAQSNLCADCQHVFFTPFLSEAQLQGLYADYRSDAYTAERTGHQPNYAAHAAEIADRASPHHAARHAYYDFALPEWRDRRGVVVDFGGYDGRFARHAFPRAEVVVMEEDFERRGGDRRATLARADLLFATHVFEHIPRPLETLRRLVAQLRAGAAVFIEVPKEYGAAAGGTLPENFARIGARLAAGQGRDHALVSFHEHVAHFSKTSLRGLALRAGLEVQELHASTSGMLSVLAHKPMSRRHP